MRVRPTWQHRERFLALLEWLAILGNTAGMDAWETDSAAAHLLAGRLRNDQVQATYGLFYAGYPLKTSLR